MRLRVILSCDDPQVIPINYQYPLSCQVRRIIHLGDPRISSFIHGGGVSFERKQFRMFTFSRLYIPRRAITGSSILIKSKEIKFIFSTPSIMIREAFYDGILKTKEFVIGSARFRVSLEDKAQPYFGFHARFAVLSPVAVSAVQAVRSIKSSCGIKSTCGIKNKTKKTRQVYLLPKDKDFKHYLKKNLENKFLAHRFAKGESMSEFRRSRHRSPIQKIYIRGSPSSKLITIKEGMRDQTRILCSNFEFEIAAHPSVIEFAYDAGIGKHNSLGFGCLDLI